MRRLLLTLAFATSLFASGSKTFHATYVATLSEIPAGTEKLDVWIPLPVSAEYQTVSDVTIESPYTFTRSLRGRNEIEASVRVRHVRQRE